MTGPRTKPIAHVAPPEPPLKVAQEPAKTADVVECCKTCKGSRRAGDGILRCHGRPPDARYTGVVMGVGPSGDAIWPKVADDEWCMQWNPKR
jgi:hypothetical protein